MSSSTSSILNIFFSLAPLEPGCGKQDLKYLPGVCYLLIYTVTVIKKGSDAMTDEEWNARAEWITLGIEKGWISEQYCATHDGGYEYLNDEEKAEYDEGGDPCEPVLRLL